MQNIVNSNKVKIIHHNEKNLNNSWLKNIEHIYKSSFPKEEQIKFSLLIDDLKLDNNDLFLAIYNEKIVGFASLKNFDDANTSFLNYLAIDENYRCNNIGSKFLTFFKNHYMACNKNGAFVLPNIDFYKMPNLNDNRYILMHLIWLPLTKQKLSNLDIKNYPLHLKLSTKGLS